MTARLSARVAALTCLVAAVTTLAGCGSDASITTSTGASASSQDPSSAPTSPSTGATPTADTTPSVTPTTGPAPAAGPELALEHTRLNIPEAWAAAAPSYIGRGVSVASPGSSYVMGVTESTSISPEDPLADFAQTWRASTVYATKQKTVDDVTVAGQPWFHLSGKVSDATYADDYGTRIGDQQVVISIETLLSVDATERQSTIDSILASVVLTP